MVVRKFRESLRQVRGFAFDVDGVCTNSRALISESGQLLRMSNMRDGYAIGSALRAGFPVAIITGGRNEGMARRFRDLGVEDVYMAVRDKEEALEDFCLCRSLSPEEVLYMGDDLPDYGVMRRVGFPTCPWDAAPEIREISVYISRYGGGEGCVRDVVEQVLKLHGKWGYAPGAVQ